MAGTQVNVNNGNNDCRVWVQEEAGQGKHEPGGLGSLRVHLNTSTLAYGSADCGRNRLMVNFVG